MHLKQNSLSDLLIAILASSRNGKRFREILNARKIARYTTPSVRVALSRLNKNKIVERKGSEWFVTNNVKTIRISSYYISSPFKDTSIKNTIIAFDISEKERKVRSWLRNQLKIFGYEMLQQSFWFGPGPLPMKFIKRINFLKIRNNIKIFTVKKQNN